MNRTTFITLFAAAAAAVACDSARGATRGSRSTTDSARPDSIARARQDSLNRASPGYVIDSVLPVEEELRRFRAAIGGAPITELQHASESREALVRRFVRDLNAGDTTDLARAALSPREFADLLYSSSPNAHPPYRQSPAFVWMQIGGKSASGLTRALKRRAGQGLAYAGHECNSVPEVQGANRLWLACALRLVSPAGDTTVERLFGTIVQRADRFKFVSYANQF